MRKDRHTNVQLTGPEKAIKLINDPLMDGFEELDDDTYEVPSLAFIKLNI